MHSIGNLPLIHTVNGNNSRRLLAADSFNRTNGSLHNSPLDVGGNWLAHTAMAIQDSNAAPTDAANFLRTAYRPTTFSNVEILLDLTFDSASGLCGPVVRYGVTSGQPATYITPNMFVIGLAGSGWGDALTTKAMIGRAQTGGGVTALALQNGNYVHGQIYKLRVLAVGTILSLFVDGVLATSVSSASYTTSVSHGFAFWWGSLQARIDNFEMYPL